MGIADYVLLALVAIALFFAIRGTRQKKGCCGSCDGCAQGCPAKQSMQNENA